MIGKLEMVGNGDRKSEPELTDAQIVRAVALAMDALMSPSVRSDILRRALRGAGMLSIPNGEAFADFVNGPLYRAISEVVNRTTAAYVVEELAPLVRQVCPRQSSVRPVSRQSGVHSASPGDLDDPLSSPLSASSARPVVRPRHLIMIVDEDRIARRNLAQGLRAAGYDVVTMGEADEALALCIEGAPAAVIVSHDCGGMSGIDLARELRQVRREETPPIVLMTAGGARISGDMRAISSVVAKDVPTAELVPLLQDLLSAD